MPEQDKERLPEDSLVSPSSDNFVEENLATIQADIEATAGVTDGEMLAPRMIGLSSGVNNDSSPAESISDYATSNLSSNHSRLGLEILKGYKAKKGIRR